MGVQNETKRAKRSYSLEFKKSAVALAAKSRFVAEAARELDIAPYLLHSWQKADEAGRLVERKKKRKIKKIRSKKRRRYTTAFKLKIVEQIIASGASTQLATAAREHKLPKQTLFNWMGAFKNGKLGINIKYTGDELTYMKRLYSLRKKELESRAINLTNTEEAELLTLKSLLSKLKKYA